MVPGLTLYKHLRQMLCDKQIGQIFWDANSTCASLADILMSEWRSALVMKKACYLLERISGKHHLVGSTDFVPNPSRGNQNAGSI